MTQTEHPARRPTAAKAYRLLIALTPLVVLLQGFLFGGFYSGGGATMLDIHLWLGRISFAVVLAVILPAALRAGFDPATRIVPPPSRSPPCGPSSKPSAKAPSTTAGSPPSTSPSASPCSPSPPPSPVWRGGVGGRGFVKVPGSRKKPEERC